MVLPLQTLRRYFQKNLLSVRELETEIELMQKLNHNNIAHFHGRGLLESCKSLFIVMELGDGGSLNQRLGFAPRYTGPQRQNFRIKNYKKPFTYPELLRSAYELADALRYLHDDAIPGMFS